MKVVILSHGHPDLHAGGAERAAYSLFQELKSVDNIEPIFVARVPPEMVGHDGAFGSFRGREDEIVWSPPPMDFERFCSGDAVWLERQVVELCEYLKPDLVHVHHYMHYGVDIFTILKGELNIPTVLTLHEYLPICMNNGQMYKTNGKLCYQSSHSECSQCFSHLSAGKFFLRKSFIQNQFEYVDHFISPSHFLISRYVDWGLSSNKFSMIENLVKTEVADNQRAARIPDKLRLGFFGQINQFKGLHVLLEAILHLSKKERKCINLQIFGANLDVQAGDFQQHIHNMIEECGSSVSLVGSYRNEDVITLMQSVDWIVIPSIWWENSPLVIQEAALAGTPILGSDIGGMKEKIIPGISGDHFMVGSSTQLSKKIKDILMGNVNIEPPKVDIAIENQSRVQEHQQVYNKILHS